MKNEISIENLVLKRLNEMDSRGRKEKIIRFPEVFARMCPIFCIPKQEAWEVLRSMKKMGLIEVVPYHGVRIREKL